MAAVATRLQLGPVSVVTSTRADGDFHLTSVPSDALEARRRGLVDLPWTMPDEVHGTSVVHVDRPGAGDRRVGDVVTCAIADAVVGIWVGDCAPVVLASDTGAFVAVHAGWRGLASGVLDVALAAAIALAPATTWRHAWVGPHIGPCCYEFGRADLAAVADAVGTTPDAVSGPWPDGRGAALDVGAAIDARLRRHAGLAIRHESSCTGCDERYFSHRVGRDRGRHVVGVWRPSSTIGPATAPPGRVATP